MTIPEEKTKLVYSTDKNISRKERPDEDTVAPSQKPSQQKVIVRLDRKRRGGKSVTVIEGLVMQIKDREALLRRLKTGLGTGGAVKESSLEIQGDHCDEIMAALANLGYRPKRFGS